MRKADREIRLGQFHNIQDACLQVVHIAGAMDRLGMTKGASELVRLAEQIRVNAAVLREVPKKLSRRKNRGRK
jgi:hypothetical protein